MLDANAAERTWIVIAAYCEQRSIGNVVAALRAAGWPRVVVVDDGSSDDTAGVAAKAGALVVQHVINRGQGAALQTGIRFALRRGAAVLVTFDADGQHRASDIAQLVAPVAEGGIDAALGSRFLAHAANVPWRRRWLLRGAVLFSRWTTGVALTDAHNGLRALSARLARRIDLHLDRMAHASELVDQIVRSGLPWREVSVHIDYTAYSLAKGQRGSAAVRIVTDYLIGRLLGDRRRSP